MGRLLISRRRKPGRTSRASRETYVEVLNFIKQFYYIILKIFRSVVVLLGGTMAIKSSQGKGAALAVTLSIGQPKNA
jgi:signal transduction histidine kinase